MKLRVEWVWDDEAQGWGFAVPALGIVGGGGKNRDEVERQAVDAIEFTLEGIERDFDDDVTEVGFFDVEVRPPQRVTAAQKAAG